MPAHAARVLVFLFIQNPEASFGFCLKKKPVNIVRWLFSLLF
jgi:hypothetical protein